MPRIANLVASSAIATSLVALGCQDASGPDTETSTSALTGAAGSVGSYVRGYQAHGGSGGGTVVDAVLYRDGSGSITRLEGTPPNTDTTHLGGAAVTGSTPWGYTQADGRDSVLYIDSARHVHEITSSAGTFVDLDYHNPPLSAPLAAPAPQNGQVPDVIGFVPDPVRSAVIYRSDQNHVIEIVRSSPTALTVTDLTSASNATVTAASGSAFPYVRSDDYDSVVYVASDNHIHELAMFGAPNWSDYDLFVASGNAGTPAPTSEPWGYKRSDGYNSVLYIANDLQMHELAYHPGGGWGNYILPAGVVSNVRPSGYVRGDGISTVVYIGNFNVVNELALVGGSWSNSTLPMGNTSPVGPVFGRKPLQGTGCVLFEGLVNGGGAPRAVEISLNGGVWSATVF